MAQAQRRANVVWKGDLAKGTGTLDLNSSEALQQAQITWASRAERPDGKTSPEELIAAAHAGCYSMALSNVLAEGGNEPEELEVNAVCTFDVDSLKITAVELNVRGRVPGMDESAFAEATREAEQGCPVSNALRGNVEIEVNASLES
jgi:osmotically inducible protein OsmC